MQIIFNLDETSAEVIVHQAYKQLAQLIWDRYQVRVEDVSISWIDLSSVQDKKQLGVRRVCVNSITDCGI